MKGICTLEFSEEQLYLSFFLEEKQVKFIEEIELELGSFSKDDWVLMLEKNIDKINNLILKEEKKLSLKFEKIILSLPKKYFFEKKIEEIVSFKKEKKIDSSDFSYIKNQVEDVFLDWDDFCVHHFILKYEINGKIFNHFPLEESCRKIKVFSHLFWIKEKLYRRLESLFYNLGRILWKIMGIEVGNFYLCFLENKNNDLLLITTDYYETRIIFSQEGEINFDYSFPFGIKNIYEMIEKKFSLPFNLAKEIFLFYVSFLEENTFEKEIVLRHDDIYLNIKTDILNNSVKNYFIENLNLVFNEIKNIFSSKLPNIFFLSRLMDKEGFLDFIRKISSFPINFSLQPFSLGYVLYAKENCFEKANLPKKSFFEKIRNIYQEYF